MSENLTQKKVARLIAKDKRYIVRDNSGLALRVSTAGKKTWLAIYQFAGRRVWYKLGDFPDCSLEDAKTKHRAALNQLAEGIDPSAVKAETRADNVQAPTVDDFIAEYLERWAKPNKRSWKTDEKILKGQFSKQFGKRKIRDIKKREVSLFLDTFNDRGAPIMANKTLAIIRKMFNFAVERDVLVDNPINLIKKPAKEKAKDRYLDEKEILEFWELLSDTKLIMSDEVRRAMKLVLVTAQRPGECVGINRGEVDGHWWTIPAERSKNGKAHRVYLSDMALKLLMAPPKQKYYFEAPRIGKAINYNPDDPPKPMHSTALPRALGRNFAAGHVTLEKFTPHDLRRTAATHMIKIGVPYDVVSKILNHTDERVTAIYNRHSYSDEIQAGLIKWSERLQEIISGEGKGNTNNG